MVKPRSLPSLSLLSTLLLTTVSSAPSELDATSLFDHVVAPIVPQFQVNHLRFPSPASLTETGFELHSFDIVHSLPEDLIAGDTVERPSGWHHAHDKRALGKAWNGTSTLANGGKTGVSAMQISVTQTNKLIIFDKAEKNALKVNGEPAWGAEYDLNTHSVRALALQTNTFCAGGVWLSNGTLVIVGGNPDEHPTETPNAGNGLTGLRFFTPSSACPNGGQCQVYENPKRLHLTSKRWYPSLSRLIDGSAIIFGGMVAGGYNNAPATDNPTIEFWPPKGTGLQIYSKFLHDALDTNLFPVVYTLPNGLVFVAANRLAMLYDPVKNVETRLPSLTNGLHFNYPATPASVLLPLTIANGFTATVLFCGGSTLNTEANPDTISSSYAASSACFKMTINTAGIKKGWVADDSMPTPRVMGCAIITPDQKVLILNGAKDGESGYGNVLNEVGSSNAKTPNYKPVLYDPVAPAGSRFSSNFPASKIERLYHNSATLLPDGRILIAGSNPNGDVETRIFQTRYDVEFLSPPYIKLARPSFTGIPKFLYYNKAITVTVKLPAGTKVVTVSLMDLGYSTHSVYMDHRLVELSAKLSGKTLTITGPSSAGVYPPGAAYLYILADGVPSGGQKIFVGGAPQPPSSASALANLQAKTSAAK